MRAFISNGEVAWEIPPGISDRFLNHVYLSPPDGWVVCWPSDIIDEPEWYRGEYGEYRRRVAVAVPRSKTKYGQ
jgi:hypothetical protein